MKKCLVCGVEKPFGQFHKNKRHKFGVDNSCKPCRSEKQKEDYKKNWFNKIAILKKSECKKKNISFDLDADYLKGIWTETCPIFKVPFVKHNKKSSWCPALDRIEPDKGYTKGNVVWISSRANRIKYDATLNELKQIVEFLEGATTIRKE